MQKKETEIHQLEEESALLQEKCTGLIVQSTTATGELETAQSRQAALVTELEAAQSTQDGLVSELEAARGNHDGLLVELTRLRDETEASTAEKMRLTTDLDRLTREMASFETVVKEMTVQFKKEVQTRETELEDLKRQLEAAVAEKDALVTDQRKNEINLRDTNQRLELAQHQLSSRPPAVTPPGT